MSFDTVSIPELVFLLDLLDELFVVDLLLVSSECFLDEANLDFVKGSSSSVLSWLWPLPDIAESRGSLFCADFVERGVDVVAGVNGVVATFCRLDLRGADAGELGSFSDDVEGGLDSRRVVALRFFGRAPGFVIGGRGCGTRSLAVLSLSLGWGSAASLAEERVTLEDICVNTCTAIKD